MEIKEPAVEKNDLLILDDPAFNPDNVCLVTGAGAGIGRATALAAAVNGLTVVGLDKDPGGLDRTEVLALKMGGRVVPIEADLTSDSDLRAAVDRAAGLGSVKFVANIAGIQHIDPIESFPMEKYDLMQRIMLRAPFLLAQLTIPLIKSGPDGTGAIGNMSSIHGHVCTINKSVYNITKFGMRALAQSIAAEGGGRLRSFTVSTGYVATPLALNQIPAQARQRGISPQEVVTEVMMARSRVKEMMRPVDVGNLFTFGFSRFAKYLDGADLLLDGGFVLTY